MKRCVICGPTGPCNVLLWLSWGAGACVMAFVAALLVMACQKPLPVSPEMRCEFDPGCGATDYPPLSVGVARDAGRD